MYVPSLLEYCALLLFAYFCLLCGAAVVDMAPEVLSLGEITSKVDVYSFGICLWELLTGDSAFKHHTVYKGTL